MKRSALERLINIRLDVFQEGESVDSGGNNEDKECRSDVADHALVCYRNPNTQCILGNFMAKSKNSCGFDFHSIIRTSLNSNTVEQYNSTVLLGHLTCGYIRVTLFARGQKP